jgi:hypothetical protein
MLENEAKRCPRLGLTGLLHELVSRALGEFLATRWYHSVTVPSGAGTATRCEHMFILYYRQTGQCDLEFACCKEQGIAAGLNQSSVWEASVEESVVSCQRSGATLLVRRERELKDAHGISIGSS